ncbi:hypothetical protein E4U30_000766 [Claviceps sp. LM220 group G6]|nr:hypothetical protein E4U30_000766 [Claviceps sp. LM220 group G6]
MARGDKDVNIRIRTMVFEFTMFQFTIFEFTVFGFTVFEFTAFEFTAFEFTAFEFTVFEFIVYRFVVRRAYCSGITMPTVERGYQVTKEDWQVIRCLNSPMISMFLSSFVMHIARSYIA